MQSLAQIVSHVDNEQTLVDERSKVEIICQLASIGVVRQHYYYYDDNKCITIATATININI